MTAMRADVQDRGARIALLVIPLMLVMLAFYLAPLMRAVVNSLHPYSMAGIDTDVWTIDNYRRLFDPYYAGIFLRTLKISAIITLVTCVLAYPVGIWITRLRARTQALVLLVFMAPWLVNVVVKAFGWSLILGGNGVINRALREFG